MDRSGGGAGPVAGRGWRPGSLLGLLPSQIQDTFLAQPWPRRRFKAGEALMRQGTPSHSGVMVILSGRVKVVGWHMGQTRVLAFRGPGDVIGELGSLSGAPRIATAVAVEPGEGMWITAATLKAFMHHHRPVRDALLGTVIAKLQEATSRRIRFDSLDVLSRVAICLREEAAYSGRGTLEGVTIKLTHPQLAELVGASVPSVQKVLKRLRLPQGEPADALPERERVDAQRHGRAREPRGQRGQDSPRRLQFGPEPVISNERGRITILRPDVLEQLARVTR